MKIRNLTTLSTARLRELAVFAAPPGVAGVFITFKYRLDYCGVASPQNWLDSRRGTSRPHLAKKRGWTELPDLMIGLRKTPRGAGWIENDSAWLAKLKRGYLHSVEYTQEEAILHLLAHEMRHLWQAKVPKGWRVWGARGKFSERDCDAYAIGVIRHWRRAGSPFYGPKGEVSCVI
jgi:hypothetical protein